MNQGQWTAVTLVVDGKVMDVSELSFKVDRSKSLLESQTIRGDFTMEAKIDPSAWAELMRFLTPHISRTKRLRLDRFAEQIVAGSYPSLLRALRHVTSGRGPGGRRNSKVSRRIVRALQGLVTP